jgi:cation transport ATPase
VNSSDSTVSGGELAEDFAEGRSSRAIEKLIKSAPMVARVRRNERALYNCRPTRLYVDRVKASTGYIETE